MHSSRNGATAGILLLLFMTPGGAWAWGKTGHAVVADIAEAHLDTKAVLEIRHLLALEGVQHLSDISSWADTAKEEHLPGSPSHTIRLPLDSSAPGPHPCPGHFCADDALTRYGAILADPARNDKEREIALKYIVHLVGDLHQPLHGVDATGQMPVVFEGKPRTLHQVWDDDIIHATHGNNPQQIADELMRARHTVPSGGEPIDWAHEDLDIAQHDIYNQVPLHPTQAVTLPSDYATQKWPIIALRLTEGGMRLANILNRLIG